MDQERFDHLARGLAAGISRRGAVRHLGGAMIGGVLAAVGVSQAGAKKKKHGGGKGKSQSTGKDKVAVCHYDADAQTYVLINVSQSGWDNGHAKHKKDFLQADKDGCCLDSDCAKFTGTCTVGKCDIQRGACEAVPTPDQACTSTDQCLRHPTCQADGTCGGGQVKPCPNRECHTAASCNPQSGDCEDTPTPGAACDGGICDDDGNCVCKPKTCAELGRVCGTAPDDGCGNPLDCGPASVCGSDISTNCCGGKCCKANGILCSSNAECCNGDCRNVLGFVTCFAGTDYTCAP